MTFASEVAAVIAVYAMCVATLMMGDRHPLMSPRIKWAIALIFPLGVMALAAVLVEVFVFFAEGGRS